MYDNYLILSKRNMNMSQNLTDINRILWESFKDIWFTEDQHHYSNSVVPKFTSVTTVIERYHSKFNAKKIAPFTAKKMSKELNRPVSAQEVLDMWKESNDYSKCIGTQIHLVMENLWYHKAYQHQFTEHFQCDDIQSDFNNRIATCNALYSKLANRYIPIKNEFIIYDNPSKLCGTIDFLAYDTKKDELVIMDWKSNAEIKITPKPYTDKMYAPFTSFYNSNFYHYCLQLSIYKAILEKNTGLNVGAMWLFHIPNKGEAVPYKVIDVSGLVKEHLLKV